MICQQLAQSVKDAKNVKQGWIDLVDFQTFEDKEVKWPSYKQKTWRLRNYLKQSGKKNTKL